MANRGLQSTTVAPGVITSFTFLSRDKILTTDLANNRISIFSYHRGDSGLVEIAHLGMPIFHKALKENFTCTPLTAEQLGSSTIRDELHIIFNLRMFKQSSRAYSSVTHVIEAKRLDQFCQARHPIALSWSEWATGGLPGYIQSRSKSNCNLAGNRLVDVSQSGVGPNEVIIVKLPGGSFKKDVIFRGHLEAQRVLAPTHLNSALRRMFVINVRSYLHYAHVSQTHLAYRMSLSS